jgi:hypothetical protein
LVEQLVDGRGCRLGAVVADRGSHCEEQAKLLVDGVDVLHILFRRRDAGLGSGELVEVAGRNQVYDVVRARQIDEAVLSTCRTSRFTLAT